MNPGSIFLLGVVLILVLGVVWYERRKNRIRELPVIAALSGIAALGRVPFAAIPSVQPTTFVVMISGYVFGPFVGAVVGATAAFVSNFFLLQGPWTLWQMLAWGLAGASAGLIRYLAPSFSRVWIGLFAFVWGFLFGWIMNVWYWFEFAEPLNWQTWCFVTVASFWFDLAHAATNLVLIVLAGRESVRVLERFQRKLSVQSAEAPYYQNRS